jgi:hypothetical protein
VLLYTGGQTWNVPRAGQTCAHTCAEAHQACWVQHGKRLRQCCIGADGACWWLVPSGRQATGRGTLNELRKQLAVVSAVLCCAAGSAQCSALGVSDTPT